jgi:flagellar protein FliJ
MKKFKFRLTTLLQLREAARDERRTLLAQAYLALEKLGQQRAQVERQLAQTQHEHQRAAAPGEVNVDRLMNTDRFQAILKAELQVLAQQTTAIEGEVEKRRQALVAADREVRVLEKLRQTQQQRYLEGHMLLDNKELDEVAGRRSRAEGDF